MADFLMNNGKTNWKLWSYESAVVTYSLIILATILNGCSSMKENKGPEPAEPYLEIARGVLGDALKCTLNTDSSLVLCQHILRSYDPPVQHRVRYCVINTRSNEVVYQAHMANGSVDWYGLKELKIRNFKGYPTTEQDGWYILNIESQQRRNYYQKAQSQKE